ncbi:MAG: hypothetical protein A3C03_01215 [Candidatus Colwellbacteria bacterium RIFCSPHIGHO2_02_FULL_45_17]|uniref:Uncharacterized protein n=2 Tax=Candidatus Colwelliibacteriota TaxID=1817904 RepID=A0A1G1ZBZ4_9BACT|nr:MAG: hypothetical protein A3C03_01215 [Candidatus Colwellbacteria bacterium RIFCSPHIGHO2_02_FULL_45_17]OGY60662.1 MAG: hypothetical protein A3I33_01820 [Candidatus Colwellbacteria bacterium RIFCSPLOWO2_02_FULL_45_11]OGY62163.1 MAG: hypothetical protein A3G58_02655 [Candidatus Colwellbacteria bacterium RIFCSPLOWO2_12_FULL_46_17]
MLLEYVLFVVIVVLALIANVVLGKIEEGMIERAHVSLWFGGGMSISRYERELIWGSIAIGVVAGVLLPLTLFGTTVTPRVILGSSVVSGGLSFIIGYSFMHSPRWMHERTSLSEDIEVRRVAGGRSR